MTKARMDGLYLLLLGGAIFFLLGGALENASTNTMADFKAIYYGAQCLTHHADPYQQSEFLRIFQAEGGQLPQGAAFSESHRIAVLLCINLPTTLFLLVPFALLSWGPAHLLWMLLIASSLILASALMWNIGADYAPKTAGGLVFLILVNSEILLLAGNLAGVVVSLCVVAAWCFLRNRLMPIGIICLALSLALKPHDAGLVWLYFLLAGGIHRKRALQTLALVIVLCVPAFLYVAHIAPHWVPELRSNLQESSARGSLNDPGPTSMGGHGIGAVISLQTVLSDFRDDPGFYNPASILLCLPVLIVWMVTTMRSRFTLPRAWLALAAISAFTMLPVYHRSYDARLLLLTVPACAMLWLEGGRIGRLALLVNVLGILFTGDLTWASLVGSLRLLHSNAGFVQPALIFVEALPAFFMLATCAFYLWVYVLRARGPIPSLESEATAVARSRP